MMKAPFKLPVKIQRVSLKATSKVPSGVAKMQNRGLAVDQFQSPAKPSTLLRKNRDDPLPFRPAGRVERVPAAGVARKRVAISAERATSRHATAFESPAKPVREVNTNASAIPDRRPLRQRAMRSRSEDSELSNSVELDGKRFHTQTEKRRSVVLPKAIMQLHKETGVPFPRAMLEDLVRQKKETDFSKALPRGGSNNNRSTRVVVTSPIRRRGRPTVDMDEVSFISDVSNEIVHTRNADGESVNGDNTPEKPVVLYGKEDVFKFGANVGPGEGGAPLYYVEMGGKFQKMTDLEYMQWSERYDVNDIPIKRKMGMTEIKNKSTLHILELISKSVLFTLAGVLAGWCSWRSFLVHYWSYAQVFEKRSLFVPHYLESVRAFSTMFDWNSFAICFFIPMGAVFVMERYELPTLTYFEFKQLIFCYRHNLHLYIPVLYLIALSASYMLLCMDTTVQGLHFWTLNYYGRLGNRYVKLCNYSSNYTVFNCSRKYISNSTLFVYVDDHRLRADSFFTYQRFGWYVTLDGVRTLSLLLGWAFICFMSMKHDPLSYKLSLQADEKRPRKQRMDLRSLQERYPENFEQS